jgi:hypothetical protein
MNYFNEVSNIRGRNIPYWAQREGMNADQYDEWCRTSEGNNFDSWGNYIENDPPRMPSDAAYLAGGLIAFVVIGVKVLLGLGLIVAALWGLWWLFS